MANIKNLSDQIIVEVEKIVATKQFKDWLALETLSPVSKQFIAFNNSFIFRENIKTVKSQKFLAFDISDKGKFDVKKLYIVEGINFNSHFKLFNSLPSHIKTKLSEAVKLEIAEIGEVIYTLVGEIQDVNQISEVITDVNIKK